MTHDRKYFLRRRAGGENNGVTGPGLLLNPLGLTEESLRELVNAFYGRVRADALIGPIFDGAVHDWPEHLEKLQSFWSSVMLKSGRYKGKPLPAHIRHSDRIGVQEFERWLRIWQETTEELLDRGNAAALQEKAARIAESLMLGIRFSRGSGPIPVPSALQRQD